MMKLVNVYILFFLFPLGIFAQFNTEDVDKLLANKDFQQQLKILDSISLTYRNENPSLALFYANKEVEIATSNNNEKLLAQSLSTRSKILKWTHQCFYLFRNFKLPKRKFRCCH